MKFIIITMTHSVSDIVSSSFRWKTRSFLGFHRAKHLPQQTV